jgi:hypothetical protein
VVYLAEAVARVVIIETTSTSTALGVSKVMPYVVAGALIAWMTAHGRRARREGERIAAETAAQAIAETAAQAAAETAPQAVAEAPAETAANPPVTVAVGSCAA